MQVYISHSAQDRDIAQRLGVELQRAGIPTWNPDNAILPGDNWAEATSRALESSDIMVALFSSSGDDAFNVRRDAQFAMTSGNYRGRIVPVLRGYETFVAGPGMPWALHKLDPIYLDSIALDLHPVVQRVQLLAGAECGAAD